MVTISFSSIAPDEELAVIPQLRRQFVIGHCSGREPDDFPQQMIEPNHALLFKGELRSLPDGFPEIDIRP